jgi:hypothetical protein
MTETNKATPSLTAPPNDAIFWAGEPQDVNVQDAGKPTPNVATPTQGGIFGTD